MLFRCFSIVCLLLLVSRVGAEELGPIEISGDASVVEISHDAVPELALDPEQSSQDDIDSSVVEHSLVQESSEEDIEILSDGKNEEEVEHEAEHIINEQEEVFVEEEVVQEEDDTFESLEKDIVISDTEQRRVIVDGDNVIVMWK